MRCSYLVAEAVPTPEKEQEEISRPPTPPPAPVTQDHVEPLVAEPGPTPQEMYEQKLKQAKTKLRGLLRMVKPGTRRWRHENEQMQCLCSPAKLVLFSNELQKVEKKITTLLRIRGYRTAQHPFRVREGQRVP